MGGGTVTVVGEVKDVQGAWLLLVHCASARANYFLRSVRPEAVAEYIGLHHAGLWECLSRILQVDLSTCGQDTHDVATLPLTLGGLGRSAERTSVPALWASWLHAHDPRASSAGGRVACRLFGRHSILERSTGLSQKSPWGPQIRTTIMASNGNRRQTRGTST